MLVLQKMCCQKAAVVGVIRVSLSTGCGSTWPVVTGPSLGKKGLGVGVRVP